MVEMWLNHHRNPAGRSTAYHKTIWFQWADPTWQARAACRDQDPEVWFPSNGVYRDPLQWCRQCPVTTACLESAMRAEGDTSEDRRHGMFGGLEPSQRAKLARLRRRAA